MALKWLKPFIYFSLLQELLSEESRKVVKAMSLLLTGKLIRSYVSSL